MQSLYVEGNSRLHLISARVKLIVLAAKLGIALCHRQHRSWPSPSRPPASFISASHAGSFRARPVEADPAHHCHRRRLQPRLQSPAWRGGGAAQADGADAVCRERHGDRARSPPSADEIELLARPLSGSAGARADDVGLAVGLVVRFVPELSAATTRSPRRRSARSWKVRPSTVLVPLIILTLKDADNIAAAIDARGIRRHVN